VIQTNDHGPTFNLVAENTSYVMSVVGGVHLCHAYWGPRIDRPDPEQLILLDSRSNMVSEEIDPDLAGRHHRFWRAPKESLSDRRQKPPDNRLAPDRLAREYPFEGGGDHREPGLRVRHADGSTTSRLIYAGYEILDGAAGPEGLPYVSDPPEECRTLRIDLDDPVSGLQVSLHYLPLPSLPVILRWARIRNRSTVAVEILRAASMSLDLPAMNADVITLDGAWIRERIAHRRPLRPGVQSVESRGGASGHQHAPFIAVADGEAGEETGGVWSTSLIYSGNHRHLVETDQFGGIRLQSGINPSGFAWNLPPGEAFDTPAAVLVHSSSGFTGLSDAHHRFVRRWLFRKDWRDRDRPVVLNTWEAHYFDVDADRVAGLARRGAEIGAEVLVLDDGWFDGRIDDTKALGDWTPDPGKFPDGLAKAAEEVRRAGLEFGLWVEPEMVSPRSRLFDRHPDWVIGAPGRDPVLARNQLVLDLGRPEVVDHLLETLSTLLSSAAVSYVKWDMNRNIVETPGPEAMHRYMLGLYRLWRTLVRRFPKVLFEGCAGGGGRFDFGSLAFMPQFWTSDQTDALERQRIQFGSSLLFPPESMGAHVSAVPNHQVGRSTPPETRGLTALAFNFGFELDPSKASDEDRRVFARLSELYKAKRSLFRSGRFLRFLPRRGPSFDEGRPEHHAWAVIGPEGRELMVFYFAALAQPNDHGFHLRLRGLDAGARYRDEERNVEFDGAVLMARGLWLPPAEGDYRSAYWILTKSP